MPKPDLNGVLRGALNPRPRNPLSRADHEALAEVAASDSGKPTLNSRFPVAMPHWDHWVRETRPDYRELLPDVAPMSFVDMRGVSERLDVYALIGRETVLRASHRVSSKALFGLTAAQFPTEYMIEYAKSETLRIAQRSAWAALLDGATRVEIRSYRRKAASSRYRLGPVVHGLVGVYTSVTDSLIDGEPTEESIAADK